MESIFIIRNTELFQNYYPKTTKMTILMTKNSVKLSKYTLSNNRYNLYIGPTYVCQNGLEVRDDPYKNF